MRITPAHAGKTQLRPFVELKVWDHPRVCGENWDGDYMADKRSGSPPRVRGKLLKSQGLPVCYGITPACAGKTCLPHLASADTVKRPSAAACA